MRMGAAVRARRAVGRARRGRWSAHPVTSTEVGRIRQWARPVASSSVVPSCPKPPSCTGSAGPQRVRVVRDSAATCPVAVLMCTSWPDQVNSAICLGMPQIRRPPHRDASLSTQMEWVHKAYAGAVASQGGEDEFVVAQAAFPVADEERHQRP